MGALSNLDDFLLNPQVWNYSVAVPGTSRNSGSENREPTKNRSLGDPCPKAVFSTYHASNLNDSEQEETHHTIFILRHIKNMEAKSSSRMRHFGRFFFIQCLPTAFMPTSAILFKSEREFPDCGKFVIECDWIKKNSQNVQSLVFFGKIDGFYRKEMLNFSKIATCVSFFLECISSFLFS